MPRTTTNTKPVPAAARRQLAELVASAMQFVPRERGEAIIGKWLRLIDINMKGEERLLAIMADATLLSADLLLSYPAASGTTAFDRLARSRTDAPAAQMALIAALRQARFRLLRVGSDVQAESVAVQDVLSGEALQIVGAALPEQARGVPLFARLVMLGETVGCMPSAITPLDAAAFEVARQHPDAGASGATAGLRWAEAVYAHVVQHGTLDVPGVNRPTGDLGPDDDLFDGVEDALFELAMHWTALADEAPDAELLQRTRQSANMENILNSLAGAVTARDESEKAMASGFERLLLVQLETVLHRERSGAGALSLEAIEQSVNEAVAIGELPSTARTLFAAIRQRVRRGNGMPRGDDPALMALVQRIRALRAKTVAQGCTEQEALAAATKAAELLDRHGLSLGELEFRAQPCDGIGIQTDRRRFAPIDTCVPSIAAFFDCRVWVEQAAGRPLRYVFFGLRGDVAAAQYLYDMVERAFRTETDNFRAGALYAGMAGERRSATNSFQVGLGRGICDKLAHMQSARDASRRSVSGRDLVPVKAAMVEEELAKLGLDLHRRQVGRGRRVLANAYTAGEAAGQRFEFQPALTEAA